MIDNDGCMKSKEAKDAWKANAFIPIWQPAKSPDLNLCDVWLWSYVAKKYHELIIDKVGDLDDSDMEDDEFIFEPEELLEMLDTVQSQIPADMIHDAMKSLHRKIKECIVVKGNRFENRTFTEAEIEQINNM